MDAFRFSKATSVSQAVQAGAKSPTAQLGASVRFVAGGTNLVDLMKLNVERPQEVLDINGLPLNKIEKLPNGGLRIGALVRNADLAHDATVIRDYAVLSQALLSGASPQLRNMATTGGNLLQRTRCVYFRDMAHACNKREPGSGCSAKEGINRGHALLGGSESCIAVYPGDWAVALSAFDARVDILGPNGERTIALEDLYLEPRATPSLETMLEFNELILRIRVPATPLGVASTFHKIRDRESFSFALASAAVAVQMEADAVREVRIAVGGVATRPWRARSAEQMLVGRQLTAQAARAAGEAALQGAKPSDDNRFRIELGARTVTDALMIARQRAFRP